jgi:hypothetical protein
MNKLLEKAAIKPDVSDLTKIVIGMAAFVLLLLIPPPPFFIRTFHQPGWPILIILFIFFTLLLRRNGKVWETLHAVMVFGLFAIALIYKWQFANYDGNIIGGLLPWSDASDYYSDAQRLLIGLDFSPMATRRPLFTAFISVLLRLVNGNLMIALACLTLVNALAVFFTIQMVKRAYGSAAASIFLVLVYLFYEKFAGKILTEQLGFALGNLALFFLLAGGYTKSLWRALLGLGLLTLALNARAGAFFILPAFILWIALYFGQKTSFLRVAGLAGAVVLMGFLLNLLLVKSIGSGSGRAFSNYSYVLYGLASGNKGWDQVEIDYPNVTEPEVMSLAIQKIRESPGILLYGMQESYKDYFKTDPGAFSFIFMGSISPKANTFLWGFVLIGLIHSYLKRKTGAGGLVLLSFLGVLASLSLLPPIDADSMRTFAATIPFTALWVVAGVSAFPVWGRKLFVQKESDSIEEIGLPFQRLALSFSVLIIVLAIPAPLLLKAFPVKLSDSSTSLLQPACGSAQKLLQGIVLNDTSITLIRNDAALESYMPFIRIGDFRSAIKNFSLYPFLEEELLNLRVGDRISTGMKLDETRKQIASLWMISKFPVADGEFSVCGHAADNEKLQPYGFYYLSGATVPPSSLMFSQQNPTVTLIIRLLYGLGLGLVFVLLITDIFGFKRKSLVNYLYALGVLFLLMQGVLMSL